ncbi:MAG: type I-E CRISPR-associated protein Cse2/CasB [Rhodospirillales bacterium]|nr:MAG: type I-E CRISPR-associated protein Cse2/CasB [Rhodospirillales bacterium]
MSTTDFIGTQAYNWWRTLVPERKEDSTDKQRLIKRGALAQLRHSGNAAEMMFIPEFRLLCNMLGSNPENLNKSFHVARLLAHVRENAYQKVARALGPQADGKGPRMSEARFRRLLQARDQEDIDKRLTRAIKMLEGKVDVADLANAVWWWNDRTRRDWAFQYFNAPLPETDSAPQAA